MGEVRPVVSDGYDEARVVVGLGGVGALHATEFVDGAGVVDQSVEDGPDGPDLDDVGPSTDLVRVYFNQIGKTALLNAEEEVDLAKRIETGLFAGHRRAQLAERVDRSGEPTTQEERQLMQDLHWIMRDGERAKNHLLEANLRLVVSMAKRYTGRGVAFLDIIQEGNLGLIRAVEKFDYTKGFKFSTYASWWIRQAITRGMAMQGCTCTIRIPVHVVEVINKLGMITRELEARLGREPTPEELAEEMDETPERVIELQWYAREPVSLDQGVGEDGVEPLGNFIEEGDDMGPEGVVLHGALGDSLEAVLATLPKHEAGIVRLRFGMTDGRPRSTREIGRAYGLTEERVGQVELRIMAKLRHPDRAHLLDGYLDE